MCEKLLHCWYDLICQSTHTLLIIHCPGCCLSKIQLNPYLINYLRKIGQRIFLWFIDIFKYVLDSTYSWMFYPLSFFSFNLLHEVFNKTYFNSVFSVCGVWLACISASGFLLVPEETWRGYCISWNRSHYHLWVMLWILRIKPDFSGRADTASSHWEITLSPLPHQFFNCCICWLILSLWCDLSFIKCVMLMK